MASSSQSSAVGAEPDYGRVRDAFLQLYETPAAERAVRLRTLCGDDLALLREVERLLAESDAAGSFLLDPARFAATDTWSGGKQVPSRLPERIGRYAIRSVLGVGGMGVVYLAEQDNPRRTVALKVLRPSLTTPRARNRFAWEAHVLARLHHPGIAQVFEAGEADTGEGPQSFFAMELVEGHSLVEHAEANKLDARARVALLAEVGDAVHHAHQRGIIHCDLKPSNILVDGSGRPKVLDFGIARAASTDQAATLATMVTSVGVLAGTLPYMSPEQTSADVDQIDVRSDVYALGVVAFECLTGRLPHDLAGKNLLAALQTVRDGEPIRLAAVAPALRGDLDTIVMHALAKDRGQRYAAASEFAADLRRYLRDEPIAARPPSGLYSLRKLAARHRGLVVGIATAFFVLAGSLIWTSVLLARTTSAEQLATRSADFMKGTLLRFNPIRIGAEVKLADVLEHMRTELAHRFPDAPALEAELRLSLAQAFQGFGRYDLCEQTIRPAIEIRRRLLGDEHPDTLACRSALVFALVSAERFTEVLPEARTIKASLTRQFGLDHGRTLPARLSLGRALLEAGSYAEARVELEATVAAAAHTLPEDDRLHLGAVQSLARLQRVFGDLADAEAGLRLVLDAYERTLGHAHSDYLLTALTLTSLLAEDLRRFADARDILQTVLPTAQRVLGEDNPNTLAMKQGLGHAHAGLGQTAEAEPLIREALAGFLRTEGPRHTRTLRCQATLAELLMQKGDLAAAKETLQELLAIATAELEPTHDLVLTQQNNLAVLQWKLGETAEALAQMRQVVEGRKQGFGEAHRYTCLVESNLSAFLVNLGQLPEAEARLTSLVPRQIAAWGARHNDVIAVRGLLADVIERRGRLVEASKHRRDNVDACVGDDGKPSASAPTHMARLARNLQRQGQVAEAAPWFLRSLELLPNGRRNDTAGKTLAASYGRALCDLDRRAEGEPLCVEFIAACAGLADADLQPPVREELGLSLLELGRHADAEPHLRAAVDASLANVAANVGALVELAALHGACLAQTRGTAAAATRLDEVLAAARTACGDDADVVHKLAAVRAEVGAEAGRPGR